MAHEDTTKKMHGIYVVGVILTKDNLINQNWHGVRHVFPILGMRQLILVFLMQFFTFHMVSHPNSFRHVSTN
jgi:hypothetical protein